MPQHTVHLSVIASLNDDSGGPAMPGNQPRVPQLHTMPVIIAKQLITVAGSCRGLDPHPNSTPPN